MVINSCNSAVAVPCGGGSVCVCVSLLWCLLVWGCLLPVGLWVKLTFLNWIFPSSTFYRAGFVNRYYLNLTLSWNILLSPSMVIEIFARYSSLSWYPWSFRFWKTSVLTLLVFRVSIEKTVIILIGLPLYVTQPVSFAAFIFFLCSECLVFDYYMVGRLT